MSEGDQVLENKRFSIHPESWVIINAMKTRFMGKQRQYPALSGLGFLGSRTKGTERKNSDLDLVIFYNSDRLDMSSTMPLETIATLFGGHADSVIVDISPKATERDLEIFFNFIKPHAERNVPLSINEPIPRILQLTERFLLAIGNEVYANRAFILNRLKGMPKGDVYFQFLMKSLAIVERPDESKRPNKITVPQYRKYPQTVSEAERYFFTEI